MRSLIDEIRGIFIAADLGVDSQITHLLAAGTHPRLKRSDNLLNSVAPKPASEDKPNVSYSSWLLLGWEGPSLPLSHFVSRIFRGNRLGMILAIFDELKFGYFWSPGGPPEISPRHPRDILINTHISAQRQLIKNRLDHS